MDKTIIYPNHCEFIPAADIDRNSTTYASLFQVEKN
jgi:hypothetical protein